MILILVEQAFYKEAHAAGGGMKIVPKFSFIFTFTLKSNRKASISPLFYICPDPFAQWLLVTSAAWAFLRHCENGRLGEGGG